MSRYYSRYSRSSPDEEEFSTTPSQINFTWLKSHAILLVILAGIGIVGATLLIEFNTRRVIHIRAGDSSDSAVSYTEQLLPHCQTSVQQYKPGDVAITILLADRPVTTQNISILNSLSLLVRCRDTQRPIVNKQPVTSLILLLERRQSSVQKERSRNNHHPVVTVTIQDAEPGQNQPKPNFNRVKELIGNITANKGAIAFMTVPGKWMVAKVIFISTIPIR